MKFKIFISSLILFFSFFASNLHAKLLPPGTGTQADVPSNLLILLDKSGSMGWRMSNAQSINRMMDGVTDSSGNIYIAQFARYGVRKIDYTTGKTDTSWGSNGRVGMSGSCRTYYPYNADVYNGVMYVASLYDHRIRKIRLSDGACLGSISTGVYPRGVTVYQNYLFTTSNSGLYSMNLNTNSGRNCSFSNNAWRYSYAIAANNNTLYSHYGRRLYSAPLTSVGGTLCPTGSTNKNFRDNASGWVYGMEADPDTNDVLYIMARSYNKMRKITVNSSRTGYTLNWDKGRYRYMGVSTASNTFFYYPWGISYDHSNDRIITYGYNAKKVQVFDENGTYIKSIGGYAATTRMAAAHKAIKAVVTDSNLTSGVNFGFGYWSSSWRSKAWPPGFSSWSGDITTGRAKPCDTQNCLKVRVHNDGAAQINKIISSVNAMGGTDAYTFMKIAQDYYLHGSLSPIDKNSPCQKSYVLVIGDGDWYNHSKAVAMAKNLFNNYKIPTFAIAFGTGISSRGMRYFNELAVAGGTTKAIVAPTAESLKTQLAAAVSQIIASKLSFTAPAITATLNSDGSLYQAQFDYAQNKEWTGTIKRTKIDKKGNLDTKDKGNWSAVDVLPKPGNRKIWSPIPGTDYSTNYNNWVESNSSAIESILTLKGFDIQDYHRKTKNTDNSINNKRCANTSGVADGTDDDLKGLINFIRGTDYFDYDADCNLTETRAKPMGDVYHSQLVVVGPPTAETAFTSENQEAYWRSTKGYDSWAESQRLRKPVIYAGSNSGVLHALDAGSGVELWGFVPPFIASRLPTIMNTNLNEINPNKGGSNAIYGVDGSPVQHDIFFQSPHDTSANWHTVLFVPYGRGGSGFSVLDVTDPAKPEHLVSIYNDMINNQVYRMDHANNVFVYDYIGTSYPLSEFIEAQEVGNVYAPDKDNEVASKQTCDDTQTKYCYESTKWTLPVKSLTKSMLSVLEDGVDITNSITISYDTSGNTQINFNKKMKFDADESKTQRDNSPIGVNIKQGAVGTGVVTDPEWDYSTLGETWSDPRIFRLPNAGAGDNVRDDDISVAVMGGGFGAQFSGAGSNVFVIDLQSKDKFGQLIKTITVEDTSASDIDNSGPASLTVITPDKARGADFAGALVYLSDLEGKISKLNLTNMSTDPQNVPIKMYDITTLFKAGASKSNGRYMYKPLDASIGGTTNNLWLYAGTGDAQRLNARVKGTNNLMIGIKDPDYPFYKSIATPKNADDITKCQNTSNDRSGTSCRVTDKDRGWYVVLKDFAKVTAQPKVNNGMVYFPVYRPSVSQNKCDLGDALICVTDDECGTHDSFIGLESKRTEQQKTLCRFVGKGVLSEIVLFAGKIFANISGKSLGAVADLVTLDAATGEVQTYRKSWREN